MIARQSDRNHAISLLNVSRETVDRLDRFSKQLERWSSRINLVSKNTLSEVWSRHILDSAQILTLLPKEPINICDMGSGGGFPGLVLAIILEERLEAYEICLIDSDQRKCAFLRQMALQQGLKVKVLTGRLEEIEPQGAQVITARALAPLPDLIAFGTRHMKENGKMIFLKGKTAKHEITSAQEDWKFEYQTYTSLTSADSFLIEIKNVESLPNK